MDKQSLNLLSNIYSFAKIDLSEIKNTHKIFEDECNKKIMSLSLEKKRLLECNDFISHNLDVIAINNINLEIELIFTSLRLMYEYSLLSIYNDVDKNLSTVLENMYFSRKSDESYLNNNLYIKYIDISNSIKYYDSYKKLCESIYLINNPSTYRVEFHKPYKVNNKAAVSHLSEIYDEVIKDINLFIYEICLYIKKDFLIYSDERLKNISMEITNGMSLEQSNKLAKYIRNKNRNNYTNLLKLFFKKYLI